MFDGYCVNALTVTDDFAAVFIADAFSARFSELAPPKLPFKVVDIV